MGKKVALIAAVSENGVYGEGVTIPWYIPKDFHHFKQLTTSCTVIMGRGTWESLPEKVRPLPNRTNSVVTNTPDYQAKGAQVFQSVKQAIDSAVTEKVFCIGGRDIWYNALTLHMVDELWVTVVHSKYPETANTRFARELINPAAQEKWPLFYCEDCTLYDDSGGLSFSIVHWVRK